MFETEIVNLILQVVSSLGFPIFVAVWLLIRTDKLLAELNATLHDLQGLVRLYFERNAKGEE